MRDQGIAGEPPAPIRKGTVTGLGVCDVWRLELSAVQWPWLVDEIEALRRPLVEELERARAEHAATADEDTVEEASARAYELRLLARVRAQLPAASERRTVVVAGPAELVEILVAGAVFNVVAALSEALDDVRPSDGQARARLPSWPRRRVRGCRPTSTARSSTPSASIRRRTRCGFGSSRDARRVCAGRPRQR